MKVTDRRTLQRMAAELKKRQAQANLLDAAFPKQRAFIDDKATLKAALCTRRAGKSYGIAIYLLDEALKTPGCSVLYAALTWKTARNILVKDVLQPLIKQLGIKAHYNKSDLTFTFENGSVLYMLGLDASEEEQEKLLGQKYKLAVIDECASFRQDLGRIVGKLRQAVASYRGSICLIGTPGDVLGYFHKVTTGEVKGWSTHTWTYHDNPYERDQQEEARLQALNDNPAYADSAEYKQYYLGEWAVSESALVYKFDKERNAIAALPDNKDWRYALGVDLGYEDDTAIVVVAFHPHSPVLYVVETRAEKHADFTLTAQLIKQLMTAYDPFAIIIDGANKQGVEEMRARHGIPFESADKTAKVDHIRLMNADLQGGRVKVLPLAKGLSDEWGTLVWDERALAQGVKREHPKCPNHLSDACLYAWRRCYNYLATSAPKPRPKRGSEEWELEEEERLIAQQDEDEDDARDYWDDGGGDYLAL